MPGVRDYLLRRARGLPDRGHQPRVSQENRPPVARACGPLGYCRVGRAERRRGHLLARATNQSLWEGILALVAPCLVASPTVLCGAGKRMKKTSSRASRNRRPGLTRRVLRGPWLHGADRLRARAETALLMNTLLFRVQAPAHHRWRCRRHARRGVRRATVVPLRASRSISPFLPGHRRLPAGLRRPVADLVSTS